MGKGENAGYQHFLLFPNVFKNPPRGRLSQDCVVKGFYICIFSIFSANPLITWPTVTKGRPVMCVKWSRSRPCVFYILDVMSNLYVFDLLEGDTGPKFIEQISKDRLVILVWMCENFYHPMNNFKVRVC